MKKHILKLSILCFMVFCFAPFLKAQEANSLEAADNGAQQTVASLKNAVSSSRQKRIKKFETKILKLKEKRRDFNEKRVAMPEVSQIQLSEDQSEIGVGLRVLESIVGQMKNPDADFDKLALDAENLIKELEKSFIHYDGDYMEERRDYTREIKIKLEEIELRLRKLKEVSKEINDPVEKINAEDLYRSLKGRKLEIEKLLTEIWQSKEPQRSRSRIQGLIDEVMEKTAAYI